jgi:hypothetical protein
VTARAGDVIANLAATPLDLGFMQLKVRRGEPSLKILPQDFLGALGVGGTGGKA